MTAAFIVARKELRGLFQSPIALLFLAVFELVVLFTFFSASRFFARNIADVRPLFEWLPILLVFLTAAVTMRAWAEERKMGTLEVLLTLPVDTAGSVDVAHGKLMRWQLHLVFEGFIPRCTGIARGQKLVEHWFTLLPEAAQ